MSFYVLKTILLTKWNPGLLAYNIINQYDTEIIWNVEVKKILNIIQPLHEVHNCKHVDIYIGYMFTLCC